MTMGSSDATSPLSYRSTTEHVVSAVGLRHLSDRQDRCVSFAVLREIHRGATLEPLDDLFRVISKLLH